MSDPSVEAAIKEARRGLREGGIPIGSVLAHGGNHSFPGEEELPPSRGVAIEVLRNEERVRTMREFIERSPQTVERRHQRRVI